MIGHNSKWLPMQHLHLKTKHNKFCYGVPILFQLQLAAVVFLVNMFIRH